MHRILVAHNEESMRILFSEELIEDGYDVTACGDVPMLLKLLETKLFSLVILNSTLGAYRRPDLIRMIRGAGYNLPVILCVNHPVPSSQPGFANTEFYEHNSSSLKKLKTRVRRIVGRGPGMRQVRRIGPALTVQTGGL
jgi:DNA-binding NtrC family response regulator